MKKKELFDLIKNLENQVLILKSEVDLLKIQLQGKQDRPNYMPSVWPFAETTPDLCSDGGQHDYPNPWFATIPPSCKKCGKQSLGYTVSYTTTTSCDKEECIGCGCKL